MRLLFINSIENVMGGAEHFTLRLARALSDRGHRVTLATRRASRIASAARERGLETLSLEMASDWHLPTVRALRDWILEKRADALFSTTTRGMMLGGHAAVLAGLRGVVARLLPGWTPGEAENHDVLFTLRKRVVHRALIRRAVTNSAAGRREIVDRGWLPASRVEVIYNGVDLSRFPDPAGNGPTSGPNARGERGTRRAALRRTLGIAEDDLVILSLSRFDRHKGQLVEMAGAREILARHPRVRFLFAGAWGGGPDYRAEVEAAHAALPDPRRALLLGERTDVPDLLEASDILIRITTAEGLPNVVLEAMASARPVVASRVAGTPEAVADGETGVLVEPGRPDEVVAALERLIASPDARRAMGLAGRTRVERLFDLRATVDAYEALFERESA